MAGGSAPRFAPDDPSLPPPWKALVDGNTGYIYYWNTDTNVTQYEKPSPSSGVPPLPPGPPPVPALAGVASKQTGFSGVSSSDSKPLEKRSSAGAGLSPPGSVSNNPGRMEEMHSVAAPAHGPSSGNRFSSSGAQADPHNNMYANNSSSAPNRPHIPEHHIRHSMDQHGRYVSDHHSRSSSDHHGGHTSGRTMSDHHGGHIADPRSKSTADSHGGHIPNHHLPEHHTGHMSHHYNRPPMHGGLVAPRSGHAVSGSGTRSSGHGMLGGGMHVNSSDSSWGVSGGRHSHSSPVALKGPPSRSDYDGGGTRSIPKLAALPIPPRQQGDMQASHYSDQQRQMGHPNSASGGRSSIPSASGGSFKRSANDYPPGGPEFHKRPRIQPFSESGMPPDIQNYKTQHEITVLGENVPPPFMTFDIANFPPEIIKELRAAGFAAPTPIQAQSWPIALQKRDIVAIAKTGSGKTLGYLLPAFLHLLDMRANSRAGPIILVLAPTRELATQIQDEAVKFGRSSRISSTCVYGGAPKGPQIRDLERGADIVIATPGRLNDFLEAKKLSLRQVSYLVLDEADRMLDMGFEPQIRKIVKDVPSSRQTLMFTATWPKEVRKIASDLLVNAVHVNIGNADELTANKAITQHVEVVQPFHKQRRLEEILRDQEPGSKVIIFCSTKKMCDQLARSLSRGFRAVAIHGDKSQSERDHVLAQFKAGRSPILVATDVAARGLDVKDIRVVINYDFPTGVEDYVHRIGRTGRAGATGEAFTFFSDQDSKFAKELVKILENADQNVPFELRQFAGRTSQSRGRSRWQTGGMMGSDESMDARGGVGHRVMNIGSKDARTASYGFRDGLVKNEPAGRWEFGHPGIINRDIGRDFGMGGRPGNMSDRGAAMANRDMRIGSRVEVSGSRVLGAGLQGEVSRRRDDVNEPVDMRKSGPSSREVGRNVEGGNKDERDAAAYDDNLDGWGATSNDGWDALSSGGGWGQNVTVGHDVERSRPFKDAWGDTGRSDGPSGVSGGRNSVRLGARQPDVRGRIFDRLGHRGRPSERSGWKDHSLDGGIAEGGDFKKLVGGKEESQRHGSFSPSRSWRASGSPTTAVTRSASRTPSKDWGRSQSRSRSPGWGAAEMSPTKRWKGSPIHGSSPSKFTTERSPLHSGRNDDHHRESGSLAQRIYGHGNRSISSSASLHSPPGERSSSLFNQRHSESDGHRSKYGEDSDKLTASEDEREESHAVLEDLRKERGQPLFVPVQGSTDGPLVSSELVNSSSTPETLIQGGKGQEAIPQPESSLITAHSHPPTSGDPISVKGVSVEEGSSELNTRSISSSGLLDDVSQFSSVTKSRKELSQSNKHEFGKQLFSCDASVNPATPETHVAANDENREVYVAAKEDTVFLESSGHVVEVTSNPLLKQSAVGSDLDIAVEDMHQLSESRELVDDKPGSATNDLATVDNACAVTKEITDTTVSSPEEGMVV